MQKIFQDKRAVLLVAVLALVSLILLAGSLRRMDFRPGEPIGGFSGDDNIPPVNFGALIEQAVQIPLWKQVTFWVAMLVVVVILTSMLNPELRKQLILGFIRAALFVIGFVFIVKRNPELLGNVLGSLSIPENVAINPQGSDVPAPVFEPPQISGWLTFLVAIAVVTLLALLFWWLNKSLEHLRTQSVSSHPPLKDIAHIARASIKNIQAGGDYGNSIIECYAQMSAVVGKKKGLRRGMDMTAREFSTHLTRSGLPREPVESLTRLFESARYSGRSVGTTESNEAVRCLTLIVQSCGETV
jgi:hypothetical protein